MKERDGAELAKTVEDALNSFGHDDTIAQFVDKMGRSHRTLQQTFTKLCVAWFAHLANEYDRCFYDLRNEASCKLGKKVMALGPEYTALPFI